MTKRKLKKIYNTFKESPESTWVCGFDDFQILYGMIKDRGYKNVLELGGGIGASTCAMAMAGAKVTTVEQSQKCIDVAKKLIPEEYLPQIEFVHSDVQTMSIESIKLQAFLKYKELPKGDWDFVFIDGPGPALIDGFFTKLPGGDFFYLISMLKPGTVIYVDGRKQMCEFIHRFFSHYFNLICSQGQVTTFGRTDRIDENIISVDALHAGMADAGYMS